jgi:phosphoribosylformylglycinamidine synthase
VYYQFVNAIKGMGEACRKFNTPVTGGNVSFYNQSVLKDRTEPVFPTPTIGMVGLVENKSDATTISFKKEGNVILLIGALPGNVHGSVYAREVLGEKLTPCPEFNLEQEAHMHEAMTDLIHAGIVKSAHDISEGGLFVTLVESAMAGDLGFTISLPDSARKDVFLFSEAQGRAVISMEESDLTSAQHLATKHGVGFLRLGTVKSDQLDVDGLDFGTVPSWKTIYQNALSAILEQ